MASEAEQKFCKVDNFKINVDITKVKYDNPKINDDNSKIKNRNCRIEDDMLTKNNQDGPNTFP